MWAGHKICSATNLDMKLVAQFLVGFYRANIKPDFLNRAKKERKNSCCLHSISRRRKSNKIAQLGMR